MGEIMMKSYLALIGVVFSMLLVSVEVHAGNPGKSAMNCIRASTNSNSSDNLVFENRCGYQVFVVWCGDLRWSKNECGDGKNGNFYTQSANISPYDEKTTTLKSGGRYQYAACEGRISFGTDGIEHPRYDNGSFRCTRT